MKPRQLASEHHRAIMRALNGTEAVSVTALVRLTGVSAVIIRRDLTELAHEGLITRVHGDALCSFRRGTAHPFPLRKTQDLEAKCLLAKVTVRLINDGESMILGNGTTCDLAAENLVGRDIAVLALSLWVAMTLAEAPGVRVVVPDGAVKTAPPAMFASPVIDVVRDFRTNAVVLGVCAAPAANGLTCIDPSDAMLKRNILQPAARAILPATPRKPTCSSVHRSGTLEDPADLLMTPGIPEESLVDPCPSGVSIMICD